MVIAALLRQLKKNRISGISRHIFQSVATILVKSQQAILNHHSSIHSAQIMRITKFLCILLLGLLWFTVPAFAQFSTTGNFTGATADPGWILTGSAKPTKAAGGSDTAALSGWLRLTENANDDQGAALYTGGSFSAITGLNISFNYVTWGGAFGLPIGSQGADGIAVFLFNANQDMGGAILGGGLGYCKGAGAFLGIGLDEYGNFSNGGDRCTQGGGPGVQPERLVLRGPTSVPGSNPIVVNPFVANTLVTGNIDNATVNPNTVANRPAFNQVSIQLIPSSPIGYSVTVQFSNTPGVAPSATGITNVLFPYAAPTSLSVGIAASTGGSKNIHEINNLVITGNAPPQPFVTKSFSPASSTTGGTSSLQITLFAANSLPRTSTTLTTLFADTLPAGVTIANPSALNTNCPDPVTATVGTNQLSYPVGAVIPANGCSIAVNVTSSTPGVATNTIPAGALVTAQGSNAVPATATLSVVAIAAPTVSKIFVPNATAVGGTATLQIRLNNPNTRATTLTSVFTDTFPAGMTVANPPALGTSGCTLGSIAATAGLTTVTYAVGAVLPAGGCTVTVNVSVSAAGGTTTYTNTLAIGALQTGFGSNPSSATATLGANNGAFLSITKNNFTTNVTAGSTTTYTIVATNTGPASANNVVVRDIPSPGINCLGGLLTCNATGGAVCPGSVSTQNFVQGGTPGTGLTISTFPSGSNVTFTLSCGVTATGQ